MLSSPVQETDVPEFRDIWEAACQAVRPTDEAKALKLFHTAIILHTEVHTL